MTLPKVCFGRVRQCKPGLVLSEYYACVRACHRATSAQSAFQSGPSGWYSPLLVVP